jgi:NitT/TauT family transport system permease protein
MYQLRKLPSFSQRMCAGTACLLLVFLAWRIATNGQPETRMISPAVLASPSETLSSFHELWFDRALARNVCLSLWRIIQGFGWAVAVGVPIGIMCGTFQPLNAFLAPIITFGKNVPMSAMVPLTLLWCGVEEKQKIVFIFIACAAFVLTDATRAILTVHERYVQTAQTLGASNFQILFKVLVPLALPDILKSVRSLAGLAFGYIILAEMVGQTGGVGDLILTSQRQGPKEHVYIVLVVITVLAYLIDRFLLSAQRFAFPYTEAE